MTADLGHGGEVDGAVRCRVAGASKSGGCVRLHDNTRSARCRGGRRLLLRKW